MIDNYNTLSSKQQAVIDAAVSKIKNESWFHGVCIDNLPSDADIDRDGFDETVLDLIADAAFHDDPEVWSC